MLKTRKLSIIPVRCTRLNINKSQDDSDRGDPLDCAKTGLTSKERDDGGKVFPLIAKTHIHDCIPLIFINAFERLKIRVLLLLDLR